MAGMSRALSLTIPAHLQVYPGGVTQEPCTNSQAYHKSIGQDPFKLACVSWGLWQATPQKHMQMQDPDTFASVPRACGSGYRQMRGRIKASVTKIPLNLRAYAGILRLRITTRVDPQPCTCNNRWKKQGGMAAHLDEKTRIFKPACDYTKQFNDLRSVWPVLDKRIL